MATMTIRIDLDPDDLRRIAKFTGLHYEYATSETVERFVREEIAQSLRELADQYPEVTK